MYNLIMRSAKLQFENAASRLIKSIRFSGST